jgi:hypothetical protein
MDGIASSPPAKACGDCRVCCQHLIIDAPGLSKHAGVTCRHSCTDKGCTIYPERPQMCRDFQCSWSRLPLSEEWRPDRCEILLIAEPENPETGIKAGIKFFFFGSLSRVFWPPFVEFASSLILGGRQIYISVPGSNGSCAHMLPVVAIPELTEALAAGRNGALVGVVACIVQDCLDAPDMPVHFSNPAAA